MMGPSGNSNNTNQAPSPCWGLGPNFAQTKRAADVPLFYTLFVPGASQMMCPNGTLVHDMVLTAVPGDAGYNGVVQLVRCVPGPTFDIADMPYTSAQQVEAGIAAGELSCTRRAGPRRTCSTRLTDQDLTGECRALPANAFRPRPPGRIGDQPEPYYT